MPDSKQQVPLNDTFYGPSIPPLNRRHAPHRRHRSCLCSLCCFLIKIILALVIIIGLAILVFWLIFRPTKNLNFHVTDASLTEFTLLENNNTLKYNLVVNLTAHNPNERVGVHYKSLQALAYYNDQRFGYVTLNMLDQGVNDTSVWRLVFKGQSIVALRDSDDDRSSEFDDETLAGVYTIDIRVSLKYKLRFGKLTTSTMKPKIACDLEVPINNVKSFHATKCKA